MELKLWTDHDDGTTGVVDTFSKKVLTKPAAFTLQHVAQRLQRTITSTGNGATMTAIVEQCVDGFLEHPLFVADDDIRCLELKKIFEPVVPVDDPSIQIIEIRGGKPASFKRNQGTQIGWNNRKNIQNHPLWPRMRAHEALNKLQPLRQLLTDLLAFGVIHRLFEFSIQSVQFDLRKQHLDCFGAHPSNKRVSILLLSLAVFLFVEQLCFLQLCLGRSNNDIILVIDHPLQLP